MIKLDALPILFRLLKRHKVLNHWLQRDLSLKGRVLLTKAEGISRLSYAAQSISVDKHTCKLIDGMLTKFMWKNKIHYIKKSVILNSYDKGGLNFIDFSSLNSNFKKNCRDLFKTLNHSAMNRMVAVRCGSAKNVSDLILLYLLIELFIELLNSRNGENVE